VFCITVCHLVNRLYTFKISVYPRIFCGEFSTGSVYVCKTRKATERWSRTWARPSLFRAFTDTNVDGTSFVKMWITRHKISLDIRIFLCMVLLRRQMTPQISAQKHCSGGKLVWGFSVMNDFLRSKSNAKKAATDIVMCRSL